MRVADVYIEYRAMAIDRSFCYACPDETIVKGMRVQVNFAHREVVGFVVKVYELDERQQTDKKYKLKPTLAKIDQQSLLNEEAFSIANYMATSYVASLMSCFQIMLPAKLKPKSNDHIIKEEVIVVYNKDVSLSGEKQKEALAYMKEIKEIRRSEFNKQYSCLDRLVSLGALTLRTQEAKAKLEKTLYTDKTVELNIDQERAIQQIDEDSNQKINVLHGVTGSGKTEVFLRLAQKVLDRKEQVLILVPEISLTPQMVNRVKSRFGKRVAIYHSALNNQEKYEQFTLVKDHEVSIVVGTRSAVFMPFDHLGLLIMDEEHDQSYKQGSAPRYHCRDIVLERARYHNSKVVLASATPSLETYARAYKGVYRLIELPKRIYDNLPDTKLVDMKEAMKSGGSYIVSSELETAIQLRLQKKEQVVILLNRRGYSPILRCVECGHVKQCPHCELALNYHKSTQEFVCHTCNYHEPLSNTCEACGSKNIKYMGIGTQRLEEHLQSMFRSAKILRMDADTTTKKGAHERMLMAFERQEYDILLGTQMIAKGLDFENVTLVGIVNGDAVLARDDYRAVELTFDLLTQASGRSGRGNKLGEVLIQVYDTEHYAIECAKNHDYKTFFKQEMQYRHLGNYPPYSYLGCVIFWSKDIQLLQSEVDTLLQMVDRSTLKVLGPSELLKINDEYRLRVIFKDRQQQAICDVISNMNQEHIRLKHKTKMEIDINPLYIE